MIPTLDTVLVGEVEEHALAIPHSHAIPPKLTFPFSIRECGYGNIIG